MRNLLFSIIATVLASPCFAATLTHGVMDVHSKAGTIIRAQIIGGDSIELTSSSGVSCTISKQIAAEAGLTLGEVLAAAGRPGVNIYCMYITPDPNPLSLIEIEETFAK